MHVATDEFRSVEHIEVELDRRRDAGDRAFVEGAFHPGHRMLPVRSPDDQLADQGVIEGGNVVAGVHVAVDAYPRAARGQPAGDSPGGWPEVVAGILRIDPAFDRVAAELNVLLADADRIAPGNPQLFRDQIDPGHHFGDGVLHLNAGVHFHEIEPTAAIEQEFNGSGAFVVDAPGCGDGGFTHALTQVGVEGRTGGFLQQFLVAPLDRAVALSEVDDIAVAVGQHLHLNVTGPVDELLHVETGIAEGGLRFPLGGLEQRCELIGAGDQPHPAATTAGGGLDHHGISHLLGELGRFRWAGQQAFAARHGGHANRLHRALGGCLVAHGADRMG